MVEQPDSMPKPIGVDLSKHEFYGVFEGGGAKGIAHCAGHLAAEKIGVRFRGVSGASAGAIYASLVAFGFTAREVFDPDNPTKHILAEVLRIDVLDLLGGAAKWNDLRAAFQRLQLINLPVPTWLKWPLRFHLYRKTSGALRNLQNDLGLLDTKQLQAGLNRAYLQQLRKFDPNTFTDDRLVLFSDLDPASLNATVLQKGEAPETLPHLAELKIVVTDVTQRQLRLCDRHTTPQVAIAEAVAASVSIPLVFKPAQRQRDPFWRRNATPSRRVGELSTLRLLEDPTQTEPSKFADGGMVSNLPIWVFEEERRTSPADSSHVLAFSLVDRPGSLARRQREENSFLPWLLALGRTAVFGGQQVLRETVDRVDFVELQTELDVLDFDATMAAVLETFESTFASAAKQLHRKFAAEPEASREILEVFVDKVVEIIDKRVSGFRSRVEARTVRVRANIALPFGASSLRIRHTLGMDQDADDDLLLPRSCLGIGQAFTERAIKAVDFGAARGNSSAIRLNRYTAARVWPELKTMLCVPIFRRSAIWSEVPAADRRCLRDAEVIGIMTFDCNESVYQQVTAFLQQPDLTDVGELIDAVQAWNEFELRTLTLVDGR